MNRLFSRLARTHQPRHGFTLIEVLIAGGVLFIVSAAIVGLNNSIIQGTTINASQAVLTNWASEGLELVSAHRDNNLLAANNQAGNQVWLDEAAATNKYGWYVLQKSFGGSWTLSAASGLGNTVTYASLSLSNSEVLSSQSITAYRLICIEAVGASSPKGAISVSCNTDQNGSPITSDGDRTIVSGNCDNGDVYCADTKPSLNRDALSGVAQTIIPAGNAVKIRSVVITSNKANYIIADVATLLTNWKGFEQL